MDRSKEDTATALPASKGKGEKNCAYCLGSHEEEQFTKVVDIEARKNITEKFGQCFSCTKKGHRAFDFKFCAICKLCKKRHHVSQHSAGVDNNGKDRPEPSAPPDVECTTISLLQVIKAQVGKQLLCKSRKPL